MLTQTEEESTLRKKESNGKKTERLERRRVSMSSVRERRGQKERNGERQKVKQEPETGSVLCYSQRHHPTLQVRSLEV